MTKSVELEVPEGMTKVRGSHCRRQEPRGRNKLQATEPEVEAKEGKNFSIAMNKGTSVTRNKKEVGAVEMKAGQSIVVDATGDSEVDLLALDAPIVPRSLHPQVRKSDSRI